MTRRLAQLLISLGALAACRPLEVPKVSGLVSFRVQLLGVFQPDTTVSLPVSATCAAQFGGIQAAVPPSLMGTRTCPYRIPKGEADFKIAAMAVDANGDDFDYSGPVSFHMRPGDLPLDYQARSSVTSHGALTKTVRAAHVYGEVRVWVVDAPSERFYVFEDGGTGAYLGPRAGPAFAPPPEPADGYSFASGMSPPIFFEHPTLAKLQEPDGFDNSTSPFVGEFLSVGSAPESGEILRQSCSPSDPNDGKPAMLVVTGTDPSGFFVTDLTACRVPEELFASPGDKYPTVRVPEPDGGMPGTYGSMFIYNYSYPEGLDPGDLLWSVAGSVQEFASTSQLTFPSWVVRERVRQLPEAQWRKYLDLVKPVEINLRLCGLDNTGKPYITDSLCGHSKQNLKLESLESALVRVRRVKFPEVFQNCDLDGDRVVTSFCNGKEDKIYPDGSKETLYFWRDCNFDSDVALTAVQEQESRCNSDCAVSQGALTGKRCSEATTFETYGQFAVEMPGPGPAALGLDDSLPSRYEVVPVAVGQSSMTASNLDPGTEITVRCDVSVTVKFGDRSVLASSQDLPLGANTDLRHTVSGNETRVAFWATGAAGGVGTCTVVPDNRTRVNLVVKDAIPELRPDCNPNDPAPALAQQCKNQHGATFDVVGHLRQVQPGRPRWSVLPRDADDVCCHPGPGLGCPYPIKPCK